jgi:hypothetical protein
MLDPTGTRPAILLSSSLQPVALNPYSADAMFETRQIVDSVTVGFRVSFNHT